MTEHVLFPVKAPCRRLSLSDQNADDPLCLSPAVLGATVQLLPRSSIFEPKFLKTMQSEINRLKGLTAHLHNYRTRFEEKTVMPIWGWKMLIRVGDYHCDEYNYGGFGSQVGKQEAFGCRMSTPPPYSMIYVRDKSFDTFVKKTLPKLRNPVYVVCSGDFAIPPRGLPILLKPQVLKWFGTNVLDTVNPPPKWAAYKRQAWPLIPKKMVALPYGQEFLFKYLPSGWFSRDEVPFEDRRNSNLLISVGTKLEGCGKGDTSWKCSAYEQRKMAVRVVQESIGLEPSNKFKLEVRTKLEARGTPRAKESYFDKAVRYRFILSPPGVGWDCTRTFHAMYAGAVPIINYQRSGTHLLRPPNPPPLPHS